MQTAVDPDTVALVHDVFSIYEAKDPEVQQRLLQDRCARQLHTTSSGTAATICHSSSRVAAGCVNPLMLCCASCNCATHFCHDLYSAVAATKCTLVVS